MSKTVASNARTAKTSRTATYDLSAAIERSARYLLIYDSRIVATFAEEEDAFLMESELGDLDLDHGKASARCEVIETASGKRMGGYLIGGGVMYQLNRDKDYNKRYALGRCR